MKYTKFEGILIKKEDFTKVPMGVVEQATLVLIDMGNGVTQVYKNRYGRGDINTFDVRTIDSLCIPQMRVLEDIMLSVENEAWHGEDEKIYA